MSVLMSLPSNNSRVVNKGNEKNSFLVSVSAQSLGFIQCIQSVNSAQTYERNYFYLKLAHRFSNAAESGGGGLKLFSVLFLAIWKGCW